MYKISELMNSEPLAGRFIVGKMTDVVCACSGYNDILIFALEKDYLFLGSAIRQSLLESGKKVCAISLDGCDTGCIPGDVFSGHDLVVAVGERAIIDLSRHLSGDNALFFVPTTLGFYYAFSGDIANYGSGLIKKSKKRLPDKVIFDVGILKKLRLKHVADGLSMIASSALWKFEYSFSSVLSGKSDPRIGVIDDALKTLEGIKEKPYETIVKCQIFLAKAVYDIPSLDFSTDRYAAYLLSKIKDVPEEEARFYAADHLIRFYAEVLKKDLSLNLAMPEHNRLVAAIADLTGAKISAVYSSLKLMDAETISEGLKRAYGSGLYVEAEKTAALFDKYKRTYAAVYKGRRKRVDFDKRQVVKVLALSAVIAEGPIRLYSDSGILALLDRLKDMR